jgi:hypothetical protein
MPLSKLLFAAMLSACQMSNEVLACVAVQNDIDVRFGCAERVGKVLM